MKTAIAFVAAATALSSIPLIAQQDDAASPGNDSAKVTYAPAGGDSATRQLRTRGRCPR